MINETNQKLVCLIDDDRIYQFTAKRIIELVNPSQKVIVFSNGKEAIDYFTDCIHSGEEIPEIVFLDINMPVMNGWEFLEAYTQVESNIKNSTTIYVVSSSIDDADIQRSKNFKEVKDFIVKPLDKHLINNILSSEFSF